MLTTLKEIISDTRTRSSKWLSTSVPRAEWSSTTSRFSPAQYFANNLMKPVLFEEITALIPKDAIIIEIAPGGLLQTIIGKSLHKNVTSVALAQRNQENNVEAVLQALGRLFNAGLNPQLAKLYPEVRFPVSRGTPMISSLIKWDHSEDWYVTSYNTLEKIATGERTVFVSINDENFQYMKGHVIDGRNLLPATGYLTLVWETLGMMRGHWFTELSVIFENVKFSRATTLPSKGDVELVIMIQKRTSFEITYAMQFSYTFISLPFNFQ